MTGNFSLMLTGKIISKLLLFYPFHILQLSSHQILKILFFFLLVYFKFNHFEYVCNRFYDIFLSMNTKVSKRSQMHRGVAKDVRGSRLAM